MGLNISQDDVEKFVSAVDSGNIREFKSILHEYKSVIINKQTSFGETALIRACKCGCESIAKELMLAGADLNLQNNQGDTALMKACESGASNIVKSLVDSGALLNVQNKEGSTALMIASYFGYDECLRELISAGAFVNMQNKDGKTALGIAVNPIGQVLTSGHSICVKLLMEAGANNSIRDKFGKSASDMARTAGINSILERTRSLSHGQNIAPIIETTSLLQQFSHQQHQDLALLEEALSNPDALSGVQVPPDMAITAEDVHQVKQLRANSVLRKYYERFQANLHSAFAISNLLNTGRFVDMSDQIDKALRLIAPACDKLLFAPVVFEVMLAASGVGSGGGSGRYLNLAALIPSPDAFCQLLFSEKLARLVVVSKEALIVACAREAHAQAAASLAAPTQDIATTRSRSQSEASAGKAVSRQEAALVAEQRLADVDSRVALEYVFSGRLGGSDVSNMICDIARHVTEKRAAKTEPAR